MARYLWCEDSKSGYQFWKTIIGKIYPDIIVETKRGNTRLRKSVERIDNDGNQYYIVMDSAIDNPDVLRETNKSKLGECFVVNCCDRTTRQDDDVCGLDDNRINSIEKAKLIVEYSVLGETIEKVGL